MTRRVAVTHGGLSRSVVTGGLKFVYSKQPPLGLKPEFLTQRTKSRQERGIPRSEYIDSHRILIPELRDLRLRYEERLKVMWIDNTRNAKIKGGSNRSVKILNGYENIDSNIFFEIKKSKITRGHNFTLVKNQSHTGSRKYLSPTNTKSTYM